MRREIAETFAAMTMPEEMDQRIRKAMAQKKSAPRRKEAYTMLKKPSDPGSFWRRAAVTACLMLCLVLGGAAVWTGGFQTPIRGETIPFTAAPGEETIHPTEATEPDGTVDIHHINAIDEIARDTERGKSFFPDFMVVDDRLYLQLAGMQYDITDTLSREEPLVFTVQTGPEEYLYLALGDNSTGSEKTVQKDKYGATMIQVGWYACFWYPDRGWESQTWGGSQGPQHPWQEKVPYPVDDRDVYADIFGTVYEGSDIRLENVEVREGRVYLYYNDREWDITDGLPREEFLYMPAAYDPGWLKERDGGLYFVSDGQNIDVSGKISMEDYFCYSVTDSQGLVHYMVVGGEYGGEEPMANVGWFKWVRNPEGALTWEDSWCSGTGRNFCPEGSSEPYPWFAKAVQELDVPLQLTMDS